jgi:hypothetical protein
MDVGVWLRDWTERKYNFEVIVGRSMPEDGAPRYLGFVDGFDQKPKRRLVDMLESQGMRANQDITFLTDGGEEVRTLTERISPCSEHVLDWFHIGTRITVLGQFAKGVAQHGDNAGARLTKELARNTASLINYGERYRSGERISSAFVEATVTVVVSKRFAKKQQMRWTRRGAHLLLQACTKTLDGTLRSTFERWYQGLANENLDHMIQAKAA